MLHPGEICKKLDEERKTSNNNDGLYCRFLICMPQPVFSFADEALERGPTKPSKVIYMYNAFFELKYLRKLN